jgi:hypothetical protein
MLLHLVKAAFWNGIGHVLDSTLHRPITQLKNRKKMQGILKNGKEFVG